MFFMKLEIKFHIECLILVIIYLVINIHLSIINKLIRQ